MTKSDEEAVPLMNVPPTVGNELQTPNKKIADRLSRGRLVEYSDAAQRAFSSDTRPFIKVLSFNVPTQLLRIIAAALFSMTASMTTTLSNKNLFKECGFPPLVAQAFQMGGVCIVSYIFGKIVSIFQKDVPKEKRLWPEFTIEGEKMKQLYVLSLLFIPRILFTNESLKRTPLSTYQILRSSAVGFSVVFTWIFLRKPPTIPVALACSIIVGGVGVASFDATVLNTEALVYWLLAATSTSLYLVMLKHFLPFVKGNQAYLLNYNSFLSFIFLSIFVPYTDTFALARKKFFFWSSDFEPIVSVYKTYIYLVLSIVPGFLINIAQLTLIKESSAVTADIIGTAKGSLQVLIGIFYYKESTTAYNLTGSSMSIIGSLLYGKAKQMEFYSEMKKAMNGVKRKSSLRNKSLRNKDEKP